MTKLSSYPGPPLQQIIKTNDNFQKKMTTVTLSNLIRTWFGKGDEMQVGK
jgi:hypothetical protein